MQPTPSTQPRSRYRRYRIVGLLPALVIVGGGFYLGAAAGTWIPLVAGLLFLVVSAGMIAYDRRQKASDRTGR